MSWHDGGSVLRFCVKHTIPLGYCPVKVSTDYRFPLVTHLYYCQPKLFILKDLRKFHDFFNFAGVCRDRGGCFRTVNL
jgi:hypothetical protein